MGPIAWDQISISWMSAKLQHSCGEEVLDLPGWITAHCRSHTPSIHLHTHTDPDKTVSAYSPTECQWQIWRGKEHLKEGEATIRSRSSCKDQFLFPSDSLFLSQAMEPLTTRSRCQPGLEWARENDLMLDVESKHNGSRVWEFDSERECLPDVTLLKLWTDFVVYNKIYSLQKPIKS